MAVLVWPLGLLGPWRSWPLVGPQWPGKPGRYRLESHCPTSLTGGCLAAKVDSSVRGKSMEEMNSCSSCKIRHTQPFSKHWTTKPHVSVVKPEWKCVNPPTGLHESTSVYVRLIRIEIHNKVGQCTDLQHLSCVDRQVMWDQSRRSEKRRNKVGGWGEADKECKKPTYTSTRWWWGWITQTQRISVTATSWRLLTQFLPFYFSVPA